jgi:hypothetical protein
MRALNPKFSASRANFGSKMHESYITFTPNWATQVLPKGECINYLGEGDTQKMDNKVRKKGKREWIEEAASDWDVLDIYAVGHGLESIETRIHLRHI